MWYRGVSSIEGLIEEGGGVSSHEGVYLPGDAFPRGCLHKGGGVVVCLGGWVSARGGGKGGR